MIIVVEDNIGYAKNIAAKIISACDTEVVIIPGADQIENIAESIIAAYSSHSNALLLININLADSQNSSRQFQKGIDLLIRLRINGILHHSILYSFETLHSLLGRMPNHLIAASTGTTFMQLPLDIDSVISKYNSGVTTSIARNENLKSVLKPYFNIERFRHREANWWGVKSLWDVHKIVTGGEFNNPYPAFILSKLKTLNNAVAVFLYESDVVTAVKYMQECQSSIEAKISALCKYKNTLHEESAFLKREIQEYQQCVSLYEKQLTELKICRMNYSADAGLSLETYNEIEKRKEEMEQFEAECSKLLINDTNISVEIQTTHKALQSLHSDIKNIFKIIHHHLIYGKINAVIPPETKILLIDDNACNGWMEIFKEILTKNISLFVPDQKYIGNIDDLFGDVEKLIVSSKPDIIMLDLRLFDETDTGITIEKTSGKLLLSRIHAAYPAIPVIMTTASNKIWSYRELIHSGASGYWIKEGIDEKRDIQETINNYLMLITTIQNASSSKFKLLDKLVHLHNDILAGKKWWTKNGDTWNNGDDIDGDDEKVESVVQNTIYSLQLYLQIYQMGFGFKEKADEYYQISNIIQKSCGIYEHIHKVDEEMYKRCRHLPRGIEDYLTKSRGDGMFVKLKWLRNSAAHSSADQLSWSDLEKAINLTVLYLSKKPC